MSVVVFLGPTLPVAEARRLLRARYRPPVAGGDVLRALQGRPRALAIIDGVFEQRPAVWHKELLWALAQGVHVYGAASMGALRAAELADFGMVGVGEVFRQYRSGALEADDEVAVAHGPAERGHRPVSEALVNVRATLTAAEAAGVVTAATAAALLDLARATFYPERTWARLLDDATGAGVSELAALRAWLPAGRVDRKRLDALELLQLLRGHAPTAPLAVPWRFEHTDAWEATLRAQTARRR